MHKMTVESQQHIFETFKKANQSHIFKYYDQLTVDEQTQFLSQLASVENPLNWLPLFLTLSNTHPQIHRVRISPVAK